MKVYHINCLFILINCHHLLVGDDGDDGRSPTIITIISYPYLLSLKTHSAFRLNILDTNMITAACWCLNMKLENGFVTWILP